MNNRGGDDRPDDRATFASHRRVVIARVRANPATARGRKNKAFLENRREEKREQVRQLKRRRLAKKLPTMNAPQAISFEY